jgi:peptide/nickel transport system ATP-binding protein
LRELKRQLEMAILLITHDLGVVAEMADSVIVMYCGKVIEQAPVLSLFQHPRHPYTQGLLKARPSIGRRTERLYSIPGQVPSPIGLGNSCYFSDRCDRCMDVCLAQQPPLRAVDDRHSVACWLYEEGIRDVRSAARG